MFSKSCVGIMENQIFMHTIKNTILLKRSLTELKKSVFYTNMLEKLPVSAYQKCLLMCQNTRPEREA